MSERNEIFEMLVDFVLIPIKLYAKLKKKE